MNTHWTFAVLLVVAVAVTVGAIKCYQCESHDKPGCFPLDKTAIEPTDCPVESKSCIILRQEAKFKMVFNNQSEPQVRYLRACSKEPSASDYFCVERAGTGAGTKNRFCSCNIDGCNHAGHIGSWELITAIILPITIILSRM